MRIMVQVLQVSVSGYYCWLKRQLRVGTESKKMALAKKIEEITQEVEALTEAQESLGF